MRRKGMRKIEYLTQQETGCEKVYSQSVGGNAGKCGSIYLYAKKENAGKTI